jgi:hypothetical protein
MFIMPPVNFNRGANVMRFSFAASVDVIFFSRYQQCIGIYR